MTPRPSPRAPFHGVEIPPFWQILPPGQPARADGVSIILQPGAGFGTGTHETTQLCLQGIAYLAPRTEGGFRMLDFGSGSGILSIGAAKLGATHVAAIEIDELAIESSEHNARLNDVLDRIHHARTLEDAPGPFQLIVANILRKVLLDFTAGLVGRLAPGGTLILSGLVSTDVPEVIGRYAPWLNDQRPDIYQRGEWRALVWRTTT